MFGLMRPQAGCSSARQSSVNRRHYCATCKTIGQEFGHSSRMSLNYDAVFLAELMGSLSGRGQDWNSALLATNKCFTMPRAGEKSPVHLRYAAAANVFLAALKLDDNIRDRVGKRYKLMRWLLSGSFKKASESLRNFGVDTSAFWAKVAQQAQLEAERRADFGDVAALLAHYAAPTAEMTADLFEQSARVIGREDLAASMRALGHQFGQIVYALDAFEDLERDAFAGEFNPLLCFFDIKAGTLSAAELEAVRGEILTMQARLQALFAALPLDAATLEAFDNRLVGNLAMRLYKERIVPLTFGERLRLRWQQARESASRIVCQPDSWAKKMQWQALSLVFFALPMLSVHTYGQERGHSWGALALLTTLLATVGIGKKMLAPIEPTAKKKGSRWQRFKQRLGLSKGRAMCDSGECDSCCNSCDEICLATLLVLLGITVYIGLLVWFVMSGITLGVLILLGLLPLALLVVVIYKLIEQREERKWSEALNKRLNEEAEQKKIKEAEERKRADAFFAENALRPEVVTLPSGLQYEILKQGDPTKPVAANTEVSIISSTKRSMSGGETTVSPLWRKPFDFLREVNAAELLPYIGSQMRVYLPPDYPNVNNSTGKYFKIEMLPSRQPDAKTTPSGLQYVVEREGDPAKPYTSEHIIEFHKDCNSRGWTCKESASAPSWFKEGSFEQEALSLMKNEGDTYLFYLPNTSYERVSFKITITAKKL